MYISRDMKQWKTFLQVLGNAYADGKEQEFLTLLLTPDERDSVGLRLQIIAQLLDKQTQRDIQQNLNTSVATVTRGSNTLKITDDEVLDWVKQQLDENNLYK